MDRKLQSLEVFVFLLGSLLLLLLTECHCPCFLSCSVPSISVQLNGSTSVSSALAGKRVTTHPSWLLPLLSLFCTTLLSWLQVSFSMVFVVYVPFPCAFVLWVSVCLGTACRKNTPQMLSKHEKSGGRDVPFYCLNHERGRLLFNEKQKWYYPVCYNAVHEKSPTKV